MGNIDFLIKRFFKVCLAVDFLVLLALPLYWIGCKQKPVSVGPNSALATQPYDKKVKISPHEVIRILDELVENNKSLWFWHGGVCQDFALERLGETEGQIQWSAIKYTENSQTCRYATVMCARSSPRYFALDCFFGPPRLVVVAQYICHATCLIDYFVHCAIYNDGRHQT